MRELLRLLVRVGTISMVALGLSACEQEEAQWETTTAAVGAQVGDREAFDEGWRDYRVGVVSGLDVMVEALESARRQTSVADRTEVDALTARAGRLRDEMIAEIDEPQANALARRAELESSFDALREDVEALLIRLGHSRDEFSAWRAED